MKSFELAIILVNIILCVALNARGMDKSCRAFYSYTLFQLWASISSLIVYGIASDVQYSIVYYLLIFTGDIIGCMVAAELAEKLLGPSGSLPPWVGTRMMTVIGIGVTVGMAVAAVVLRYSSGHQWARVMVTVEQWMSAVLWITFSSILVFWRTLKVFRRNTRAASICLGFVLYFTVSIFSVFFRGHSGFSAFSEAAKQAAMIAYFAMLLWWTVTVLLPAPVFERSTSEQKQQVFDEFEQVKKDAAIAAS